jgi:hypothetical protein
VLNSCLFLASGIPVISSFCHMVIILSKYKLKSVGEREQPWHTILSVLSSFDNLKLNFIDILFLECMSIIVFNNVSGSRLCGLVVSVEDYKHRGPGYSLRFF